MKVKIPLQICKMTKRVSENNFGGTFTMQTPPRKIAEGNIYPEDNVQLNTTDQEGAGQVQYSSIAQLVRMIPGVKRVVLILETDEPL